MELRQLRHFLALVEERSITRAAKRELIVQSGLSNSIQALERELGAPLYVRGTRPVRLTAAGEALVGAARRTLASAAQAEQAVHHTRDVLIGTLRIGVSLSAQHLVPFASYLGEFTRDHPGIDLRLQYAPALTMIAMVGTGELDCVIGPALSQVPGVRMTRLAAEPLHLACRADHRLAGQAQVTISQLADERFVEVPAGWTGRLLSDAAFAGAGIPRRVVCEVGDWELFLELVSAGVGIGFAPAGLQYAAGLTMISMVQTGELDCVIGPAVSQVPGVRMARLAGEPLHLVCRADHRLAEQAEVSMGQLASERFVEVPTGWTARLLSDAAFASEGIPRRVVCEVGDWELFLELVGAGVGIGFAPVGLPYPVLTAPDSVLRLIAVEGARLERHIYLILPSVGETSPAARRFADQLLRIRPAGS